MNGVLPGDTVFLIEINGHRKVFSPRMVYSISPKRREVKLHGSNQVFDRYGKPKGLPSWSPVFWIEPITPGLMTEIRENAMNEE